MNEVCLAAHRALGCRGATRSDVIVTQTARSLLLEVNTLPGMTATSLLPKIAAGRGIDFPDLCERLLLERVVESLKPPMKSIRHQRHIAVQTWRSDGNCRLTRAARRLTRGNLRTVRLSSRAKARGPEEDDVPRENQSQAR